LIGRHIEAKEAVVNTSSSYPVFVISAAPTQPSAWYFAVKRCIDVVLSSILLLLLSPLMLLIVIAIRLDSPGPIIFGQERVGVRRRSDKESSRWEVRSFRFYKFRSMATDADSSLHEAHIASYVSGQLEGNSSGKSKFKLPSDPRITRVGRILRKSSLDELPQLVNVLKGDMSLVGPRPVPLYEVAHYQEWHYERLTALPGITGLWQVNGRCDLSFDEMIRLDLEYSRHQSLKTDAWILILTIPAVLRARGAG
jgi:lipopolysaccharide/colanic/teichoic acid biosynthesis glycosyltransferase